MDRSRGPRTTGMPLCVLVSLVLHAGLFAAGAYVITDAAGGTGGGGSGGDEPAGFVIHVRARSAEPAPAAETVSAPEALPTELAPVETPIADAPPPDATAPAVAADALSGTSEAVQSGAAKAQETAAPEAASSGSGGGAGSGEGAGVGTHEGAGADEAGPATRTTPATLVFDPKPDYPTRSVLRGEVGSVLCTIQVGADGRVEDVRITRSSGHERLDRAAAEALRRWIFEPARVDGRAVPTQFVHQVVFRLD